MANLQEELRRFLTARFGADVKDAFVSCIQKIHKDDVRFTFKNGQEIRA